MTLKDLLEIYRRAVGDTTGTDIAMSKDLKVMDINAEYMALQEILTERDWNIKTADPITIVAGTREYDLPQDFGKTRKVRIRGIYGELLYDPLDDHPGDYGLDSFDTPSRYRIQGAYSLITGDDDDDVETFAQIVLRPKPSVGGILDVKYTPIVAPLADDTDIPNLPETDHEIIAVGAIRRAMLVQGMAELKKSWDAEYGRLYIQLLDHIVSRQTGKPRQMRSEIGETL